MPENKSLCPYPWISACVYTTGLVKPCCFWDERNGALTVQNSNTSNDPRNSEIWNNIREDMLVGKTVKGCEKCYELEASGGLSGRQAGLIWFVPTENKLLPIDDLEVSFSNLCNLACVGCSDENSTKWSTENIKAGRKGLKLIDNKFNWQEWDLSKLKRLKIIGGEPFMEADRFCNLLEKINLSEIEFMVFTNGTILPNERLKSLIEKCKNVNFIVSFDGYKTVNDWCRWPSKFKDTVSTMNIYQKWWGDFNNINLSTNSLISIYNIFTTEKFIDFMKINFDHWKMNFNWVQIPDWPSIKGLPNPVKQDLINRFSNKSISSNFYDEIDFYNISIEFLKMDPTVDWQTIKSKTIQLAKERNLDIDTMLPELKKVMDDY